MGSSCSSSRTEVSTFEESCDGQAIPTLPNGVDSVQAWVNSPSSARFCYDCGSFLVATTDQTGIDCMQLASDPPVCPIHIDSLFARIPQPDGGVLRVTEVTCENGSLKSYTEEELACAKEFGEDFRFAQVCRSLTGSHLSICTATDNTCGEMGLANLETSPPPSRRTFFESLCDAVGPDVGAAIEESRCINATHRSAFPYGCENGDPVTLFPNETEVVGTEWVGRVQSIVDFYEEMTGERDETIRYCHECGSLVALSSSPSIDCSLRDENPPVCPSGVQYLELSHPVKVNTTHEVYNDIICVDGNLDLTQETGAWCAESHPDLPFLNICRISDGRQVRFCLSSYMTCSELGFEDVGTSLPPKPSESTSIPPPVATEAGNEGTPDTSSPSVSSGTVSASSVVAVVLVQLLML